MPKLLPLAIVVRQYPFAEENGKKNFAIVIFDGLCHVVIRWFAA